MQITKADWGPIQIKWFPMGFGLAEDEDDQPSYVAANQTPFGALIICAFDEGKRFPARKSHFDIGFLKVQWDPAESSNASNAPWSRPDTLAFMQTVQEEVVSIFGAANTDFLGVGDEREKTGKPDEYSLWMQPNTNIDRVMKIPGISMVRPTHILRKQGKAKADVKQEVTKAKAGEKQEVTKAKADVRQEATAPTANDLLPGMSMAKAHKILQFRNALYNNAATQGDPDKTVCFQFDDGLVCMRRGDVLNKYAKFTFLPLKNVSARVGEPELERRYHEFPDYGPIPGTYPCRTGFIEFERQVLVDDKSRRSHTYNFFPRPSLSGEADADAGKGIGKAVQTEDRA